MSSTGKLVVSFEADPPPVCYSPKLQALEERIRVILTPYVEAFDLAELGNTFILTSQFGSTNFETLIASLIEASTGAWLLIYGGLDGDASVMIEAQDGKIVTQRERVPVDTLNDYSDEDSAGKEDDIDRATPECNDIPF